jgi:radical SAM enzyme (TIGR01210 family)
MNELAEFCRDLKKDFTPKIKDSKKPVSFWSEKDVLGGKIVDAFVIIFRTRGCSWAQESGCSMCGYFNDSLWDDISDVDLLKQFDTAMNKYSGQKFVKIFTSGSFLDDTEIKPKVRKQILDKLAETADKISVESRPEFITDEKLSEIKDIVKAKTFEIGIGLETANDSLRDRCINKGFKFDNYKKAAKTMKKYGFKLKTYVLVKPPFLTEKESIEDAKDTVDKIKSITNTISFNPTNVQRNTLVNYLWQRKQYRPSWLFSIVDILKESKKIAPDVFIKCDIAGGGSIRGAHNCKNCDRKYLNAIDDFSLNQNVKVFKDLDCDCKENWLDLLDIEDLTFGSIIDI